MRQFVVIWLNLMSAVALTAATQPIRYFDEPVDVPPSNAPTVNATRVVIRNRFNINTFTTTPLPFQMLNMQYFTNTAAGHLLGSPGYRFDFFTNNSRRAMHTWVNQGTNSGSTWLTVWATNISSTGTIMAGPAGLVRLDGRSIALVRNSIRAGLEPGQTFGDGATFLGSTNYFNAPGISDLYWGTGTNNFLNNQGDPMPLGITNSGFPGNFVAPCAVSPQHQVHDTRFTLGGGGTFTNFVTVPEFFFLGGGLDCFKQFDAYAYTAVANPTSRVVQVAFVSRNLFDTNSTATVRFVPDSFDVGSFRIDEGTTIMVEFGSAERDLITGRVTTNRLYFIDRSAFTNLVQQRNLSTGTRKPNTYEVRRSTPFGFTNAVSVGSNTVYSPDLLYNPSFISNAVEVGYAAYRFRVSSTGESNLTTVARHPTNMPGRVEIIGDNVNLDRTRIRAESTTVIRAKNLISNAVAQVDAPFNAFDLGSTASGPLVISNLSPAAVQRLSGEIAAWSATWENFETNTAGNFFRTRFHVLMLDNELVTLQPVVITDLALRSSHVVIRDVLNVRDSFFTDARDLHIAGSGSLSLPFGAAWRTSNVPNLINFTNDGGVNISGAGRYGTDRTEPYGNFINRGTNIASSQFIRANRFENSGCLLATAGLLSIDATSAEILGGPATISTNLFTNSFTFGGVTFTNVFLAVVTNIPGKIQGNADVQIVAQDFVASNSFIRAGAGAAGALILSVGGRITDGGVGTSNYWAATAGFDLPRRPSSGGDLLGTHLSSLALIEQQEVFHTWPAEDRGASTAGYNNNLALLKLTLDGAPGTLFHFNPPGGQGRAAIYVDYLELLNWATNYNVSIPGSAFDIPPNMTIYFANANISPNKIMQGSASNFVWVSDYAGALSSIDIVYPSPPYPTGTVVTANIALATSTEIDSDGDNIVNADDPDPFFIDQSVGLGIEISKSGDGILSWNALKDATNVLECADTIRPNSWVTVTNFVQAELTTRVRVRESLSQTNQRIYRVRVLK